jgi:flagellar biosynthetic protein FliR
VIDFEPMARLGLLLVRPGSLVMTAPAFGETFAPVHLRIGLTVMLAFTLTPVVAVPEVTGALALGVVIAREMAIGFAFALAMRALIAGAELAGQLSGVQLQLSYGSVVNPQGGVRNNVIGNLYANLALFTFFLINGPHVFIRSLASSYQSLPIGAGGINASIVTSVTDLLGIVFALGVRLAAPLIVVMLVLELASGLISRTAPAINLMVVSTPLRLIVGLLTIAALVPAVPPIITRFAALVATLGAQTAGAFK